MTNGLDRMIDGDPIDNDMNQFGQVAARHGDKEQDPYQGLNVQMDHGTHLQMDHLLGFIQSGYLDTAKEDFVLASCELGLIEYHAQVNNRFGRLRLLRKQLEAKVGDEKVFQDPSIREWTEARVMAPLPRAVWKFPEARHIRYIQSTVLRDQQAGVLQDFTRLHDHFKWTVPEHPERAYDAEALEMAPFFIQKALAVNEVSRNSKRDVNVQALIARMLAHMSPEEAARQRGAQKGQVKGGKTDDT